jgi:hypothetical protein
MKVNVFTTCLDWAIEYGFDLPKKIVCYHEMMVEREAYKDASRLRFTDAASIPWIERYVDHASPNSKKDEQCSKAQV